MKTITLFFSFILISSFLTTYGQAKSYRFFKVDWHGGYSRPSTEGYKLGVNLSLEPKFNITDHITVGLKGEGVLLLAVRDDITGDGTLSLIRSFSLTGEYYFGEKRARPYVGMASGLYNSYAINTDAEDLEDIIASKNQIGFAPRAGIQFNHYRIGFEYNFVKNNNYFSVKTGVTFGGGKKK